MLNFWLNFGQIIYINITAQRELLIAAAQLYFNQFGLIFNMFDSIQSFTYFTVVEIFITR